jgi:hypothetical protein
VVMTSNTNDTNTVGTTAEMAPPEPTTNSVSTPDDIVLADPKVKDLIASVTAKLEAYTHAAVESGQKKVAEVHAQQQAGIAIADPVTFVGGTYYQWCDLFVAGPFQSILPTGPFLPTRVLRSGEAAVMLAILWRNPAPIGGGFGPSAAQVMSPFEFQVKAHGITINTGAGTPDVTPPPQVFGPGFVNIVPFTIPTLPAPPDGDPRLLEYHVTFDVKSVGVGLPPFAGFATRWFNPDFQPPFLGLPGINPGFIEEAPVRVLVYR